MLCRIIPKKKKVGAVPVYLNVYDLTPINGYAYWVGLGVYHSGVQVHGVEYAFGAHDHTTTGVFEVEPKQCPGFTFRKSILIGRTDLGSKEVRILIEKLSKEYLGNTYHLISKNCNHFCNDLCIRLTAKPIPSWVNRLARLGMSLFILILILVIDVLAFKALVISSCLFLPLSLASIVQCLLCKCVLPAALDETKVRPIKAESKNGENDKKKYRSQSTRFESSSTPPSTLSTCSSAPACRSRRQRRCVPPSSSLFCSYPQSEPVS
ncbi:hypothetical protein KSS87_017062 [Heliosperma pusillum]|nr:hypothetical protein KSS87_017062 [Heliosperma pusillum]